MDYKLFTIDLQVSWLTAPYFLIVCGGILRIFIFELFEYVTKPRLKTFDEPLIEVIELESNPPVQDSAKDILSFFLTNSLTTFFDNLFI